MKSIERVLKCLADPNRLRILKLLERRKMCVCELSYVLGIRQPSVSRHLKRLKGAGLVCGEQDGFWTNYFLCRQAGQRIKVVLACICAHLEEDPVVKRDMKKAASVRRDRLCVRGT